MELFSYSLAHLELLAETSLAVFLVVQAKFLVLLVESCHNYRRIPYDEVFHNSLVDEFILGLYCKTIII